MTAEELLAYKDSHAGIAAAREFLSEPEKIQAQIGLHHALAEKMRDQAQRLSFLLPPDSRQELKDMEEDIQRECAALVHRQKQIDALLRRIPNETIRTVMQWRYLQNVPFFRIAMEMQYDERHVYRLHRKGLEYVAALLAVEEER